MGTCEFYTNVHVRSQMILIHYTEIFSGLCVNYKKNYTRYVRLPILYVYE